MEKIIDKLILFLLCGILSFLIQNSFLLTIIPIAVLILFYILSLLFKNIPFTISVYFIFLGICCYYPVFSIFLPILIYDINDTIYRFTLLFSVLPLVLLYDNDSPSEILFTIVFIFLALLLSRKTLAIEVLKQDYEAFRETSHELSRLQEEKNRQILSNQDYEIRTATLNERNRISKEIHDHVGHLLSRSLLQVGALLTIVKDEAVREGLISLKQSISEGMDSIRNSIHNMHDESIDLEASLEGLVREFTFCPVIYHYEIRSAPPLSIKYACIATVKEALTNIIKHSNASEVNLSVTENKEHYFVSLKDNGTVSQETKRMVERGQARREYPDGLGLQSINDRIKGFHGDFKLTTENGFAIEITIPKEEGKNEPITD